MIQCTHLPWILDITDEESTTELETLRGHMARPNPHIKAIVEAVQLHNASNGSLEQEVCVLFNGQAHSYVTPKFYVETKPRTGKVVPPCVPTWNYSAAQAYGKATFYFDSKNPETTSFLKKQIIDLTNYSEENIMNYKGGENPCSWKVTDAPVSYVDLLRKNIIGVEITIDRLEGKFKMSQELGQEDCKGVSHGFEALGTENGFKIARTVEERGAKKAAQLSQPAK